MALTASQIRTEKSRSLSQSSGDNVDSTGKFLKFDVREDEEQLVKLQEIIDLLVAGGYFRARIKGVDHFDKVILKIIFQLLCYFIKFIISFYRLLVE